MDILLVRHGETEWNAAEVFRGRADIPLNETGLRQAELLSDYLAGFPLDGIYSSPMKRAWQTAESIARRHGKGVYHTGALIDLDFGEWQGLSHSEAREKFPAAYDEWLNHPEKARMPSGEGLEQVRERVTGLIEEIVLRSAGRIALVSHRVVIKVLICTLLGLDNSHFWNIKLDNCGITTFSCENGRYVLVRHNDTSFLHTPAWHVTADF